MNKQNGLDNVAFDEGGRTEADSKEKARKDFLERRRSSVGARHTFDEEVGYRMRALGILVCTLGVNPFCGE